MLRIEVVSYIETLKLFKLEKKYYIVGWLSDLDVHASKMFLFIQFSALTVYFVVLIDFPLNLAAVFRFLELQISSTNNDFGYERNPTHSWNVMIENI